MHITRAVVLVSLAVASSAALAQTYTFYPTDPIAGYPIVVAASWPHSGNFVNTTSAVLSGNSVTVRFVQDGGNFEPNPQFITASVYTPRLAAGIYTFTIIWVPGSEYMGPVDSPQVFTIVVRSLGPDPATVPGLSGAGIALLALLLSVAGWFVLRRRLN